MVWARHRPPLALFSIAAALPCLVRSCACRSRSRAVLGSSTERQNRNHRALAATRMIASAAFREWDVVRSFGLVSLGRDSPNSVISDLLAAHTRNFIAPLRRQQQHFNKRPESSDFGLSRGQMMRISSSDRTRVRAPLFCICSWFNAHESGGKIELIISFCIPTQRSSEDRRESYLPLRARDSSSMRSNISAT